MPETEIGSLIDQPESRPKMVGWYNPAQLFRTGIEVVVSTLLAQHIDKRPSQITSNPALDKDYSRTHSDGEFRFHYVADMGDGWNSTYAVAYAINNVPDGDDGSGPQHGNILIFGGDLVYPTASLSEYQNRLIMPYRDACRDSDIEADVFALPGNHDWYDSLVSFTRIFCNQSRFASWHAPQSRSYFAVCLPGHWWMFGLDTQLVHDIDKPQFDYFSAIASEIPADGKVILCTPEPYWLAADVHANKILGAHSLLDMLVEEKLGDRVRLFIAGDLHHYRRHSDEHKLSHKITCGMGGAFLHPTHVAPDVSPNSGYAEQTCYPPKKVSQKITWQNCLFLFKNPRFGMITGIAYLLVAWANGIYVGEEFGINSSVPSAILEEASELAVSKSEEFGSGDSFEKVKIEEIGKLGISEIHKAAAAALHSAILSPLGSFLYMIVFFGFWFFTDRSSSKFRAVGGVLHAGSHIVAGFFVYWLAVYVSISVFGFTPKSIPQYLTAGAILVTGGWIIGSIVFSLYLMISLNAFGKHYNEAFSSLKIEDYKGFLKMWIDATGTLHVNAMGINRVPRNWVSNPDSHGPRWRPAPGESFSPEVIDTFSIK